MQVAQIISNTAVAIMKAYSCLLYTSGEDTAQLEKAYKDIQAQIQKEYITKQKEQLDEQDRCV